jgi:hypothetical protein
MSSSTPPDRAHSQSGASLASGDRAASRLGTPLHARLERAGRILREHRETSAAEDCFKAADVLKEAARQISRVLDGLNKRGA